MRRCLISIGLVAYITGITVGCGSSSKELDSATTTPQVNEEEVKKQMEKSKEMALEQMKKSGRPIPPNAGGAPQP